MIIQLNGLDQTTAQLKTYFDVSAYRNVLDILNTYEITLDNFGKSLFNSVKRLGYFPYSGVHGEGAYKYDELKQIRGFAIKLIGNVQGATSLLLNTALKNNALGDVSNSFKKINYLNISGLTVSAQNLSNELNRLRLPLPANFRQINNFIMGKKYQPVITRIQDPNPVDDTGTPPMVKSTYFPALWYMNLYQLILTYGKLKNAINTIRIATEKEIDAANLAEKVQQETIRKENDAILSRKKIAAEADAKKITLLAEKKKAYDAQIKQAATVKAQLIKTQTALAAKNAELEKQKNDALKAAQLATKYKQADIAAQKQKEATVITLKQKQIDAASKKMAVLTKDKISSINMAIKARDNLTTQIISSQTKITDKPLKTKKSYLPIIATIAAGVLLR